MTRKDYIVIAKCLNDIPNDKVKSTIVERLAYTLSLDNVRFNHFKFMRACGLDNDVCVNIKNEFIDMLT